MQVDMFGAGPELAPEPVDERTPIAAKHAAAIETLPEVLRPTPMQRGAELDDWTRTSQRAFLLWMIGAIARGLYTVSSMAALPGVLQKLNGLGGEW
ncbi:hypothetical protein [Paraburkholderia unamae]|uniref:MFS transporter n=1 Tax=Paraburkholderia unamae TaxID=219649 RepID=A0ABX5KDQ6_9BURK|nr:hypothetical protein [Paraburkholderia unamae]PVX75592.1 hypothetical protein C7402_1174 [Paraburkholderia unamae]